MIISIKQSIHPESSRCRVRSCESSFHQDPPGDHVGVLQGCKGAIEPDFSVVVMHQNEDIPQLKEATFEANGAKIQLMNEVLRLASKSLASL